MIGARRRSACPALLGSIAAARVGWIDGAYVLNPTVAQMDETDSTLSSPERMKAC